MKPGDLVRIVPSHFRHGGKIAVIVEVMVEQVYGLPPGQCPENRYTLLMDGKIKTGVASRHFEVIDETG
jgi:hypothetical protein